MAREVDQIMRTKAARISILARSLAPKPDTLKQTDDGRNAKTLADEAGLRARARKHTRLRLLQNRAIAISVTAINDAARSQINLQCLKLL